MQQQITCMQMWARGKVALIVRQLSRLSSNCIITGSVYLFLGQLLPNLRFVSPFVFSTLRCYLPKIKQMILKLNIHSRVLLAPFVQLVLAAGFVRVAMRVPESPKNEHIVPVEYMAESSSEESDAQAESSVDEDDDVAPIIEKNGIDDSAQHVELLNSELPSVSTCVGCSNDDEITDLTSWSVPMDKHQKHPLSSEEIKLNKTACIPADYVHWHAKVISAFELRNPKAAALMRMPYSDAAELVLEYPIAAEANAWLASALRSLLDTTKKEAELFEKDLIETELKDPGVACSGIDVSELLCHRMTQRDSSQEQREWDEFVKTSYIKVGQSEVDIRLAVKCIVAKMRVVPSVRRDAPYAVLRAIIGKIPSSPPALDLERQKYERALDLAEKLGEPPTIESKELDVRRLTEWVITDIRQHSTAAEREVSAAERDKRAKERKERQQLGPCTACGEAHHWKACTKGPCTTCKQKWCQGAPHVGKVCYSLMDDPPEYKNALGKPFPVKLQQHANDLRKANGKPVKEPEVSMLELAAVTSGEARDVQRLSAPATSVERQQSRGEDTDEYSDDESESGDVPVPGSRFSVLTAELSMLERGVFEEVDDGEERPAGSGEPEPYGEGYSRLRDRSKATISFEDEVLQAEFLNGGDHALSSQQLIDESRLIQLRYNSVCLIQMSWRIMQASVRVRSLVNSYQPFDGPPHHVHKWWWDHGPCIACNSDLMWVCRTCGASWCQCIGIPRPFYGPAVPGPVWWGAVEQASMLHRECAVTCIASMYRRHLAIRTLDNLRDVAASWRTLEEDLYMDAACIQRAWRLHSGARRQFNPEVRTIEAVLLGGDSPREVATVIGSPDNGAVVHVQSDSGANVVLAKPGCALLSRAVVHSGGDGSVALASDAALGTAGSFDLPILVPMHPTSILHGDVAAALRRDVIGTSVLWRQSSIAVLTHPFNVVVHAPSRRVGSATVINDLYYIAFVVRDAGLELLLGEHLFPFAVDDLHAMLTADAPEVPTISTIEHRAHHMALVWAVRLGTDGDGLKRAIVASRGINVKVTPDAARLIASDAIRRGTIMRRRPVAARIDPADAPTDSGTHWQIDGWGHMTSGTVFDRAATYMWVLVDEVSDFAHGLIVHSSNQQSVIDFLDVWHAAEVAFAHTPKALRVDAVPNFNTSDFRALCAARYQLHVPEAAGGDHDGAIPRCEAAQDPFTRGAESMVKRAGKGASYFLLARLYKLVTRNHLVKYDKAQSRFHHHTGRPNDFTSHPPLIFGARCNVLIEREKRDGIGAQRYEECEVVGMTLENKYVLRKLDTGRRIVRRTVDPIDELELAQRGLPSSVWTSASSTSTIEGSPN